MSVIAREGRRVGKRRVAGCSLAWLVWRTVPTIVIRIEIGGHASLCPPDDSRSFLRGAEEIQKRHKDAGLLRSQ
jgi:hypothetical protein